LGVSSGEAMRSWVVGYAWAAAEAGARCWAVACRRRAATLFRAEGGDILVLKGAARGRERAPSAGRREMARRVAIVFRWSGGRQQRRCTCSASGRGVVASKGSSTHWLYGVSRACPADSQNVEKLPARGPAPARVCGVYRPSPTAAGRPALIAIASSHTLATLPRLSCRASSLTDCHISPQASLGSLHVTSCLVVM
jgi:hypothetical protein